MKKNPKKAPRNPLSAEMSLALLAQFSPLDVRKMVLICRDNIGDKWTAENDDWYRAWHYFGVRVQMDELHEDRRQLQRRIHALRITETLPGVRKALEAHMPIIAIRAKYLKIGLRNYDLDESGMVLFKTMLSNVASVPACPCDMLAFEYKILSSAHRKYKYALTRAKNLGELAALREKQAEYAPIERDLCFQLELLRLLLYRRKLQRNVFHVRKSDSPTRQASKRAARWIVRISTLSERIRARRRAYGAAIPRIAAGFIQQDTLFDQFST